MPRLPSGRHVAVTAARFADLVRQYEETGEPEEIGRIHGREDIAPFIDVLYFRPASSGSSAGDLPAT